MKIRVREGATVYIYEDDIYMGADIRPAYTSMGEEMTASAYDDTYEGYIVEHVITEDMGKPTTVFVYWDDARELQ